MLQLHFQKYTRHYLALIFILCSLGGLLVMSRQSYADKIALSADQWEYQSVAVNLLYGHGFPIRGGIEDSAVYKMYYYEGMPDKHDLTFFYGEGKGLDLYRNPVYPLFMALVYKIFSVRPEMLLKIQFLLLVLAGSLLPYLGYRMFGASGILAGICAYIAFLHFDQAYALQFMTEGILIVYAIILTLYYTVADHRHKLWHAAILGALFGIGLLLKNYFMPLVAIQIGYLFYQSFISRLVRKKVFAALIAGLVVVVLPWTIYANYTLHKSGEKYSFVFITSQGDDVLLASNNEYAANGGWHPEWSQHSESFFNKPDVSKLSPARKVIAFYKSHKPLVLEYFAAKLMAGHFVTVPQILFYLSALFFVIAWYMRRKWLFALPFVLIIAFVVLKESRFETIIFPLLHYINTIPILKYELVFGTIAVLWAYVTIVYEHKIFKHYFIFLQLLTFAILTIVFYGLGRITGVLDFACLILAAQTTIETFKLIIYGRPEMISPSVAEAAAKN